MSGLTEPSFLGVSWRYVKKMKLGWFGIFSCFQQRHLANSSSSSLGLDSPTSPRSLDISCRGLAPPGGGDLLFSAIVDSKLWESRHFLLFTVLSLGTSIRF